MELALKIVRINEKLRFTSPTSRSCPAPPLHARVRTRSLIFCLHHASNGGADLVASCRVLSRRIAIASS